MSTLTLDSGGPVSLDHVGAQIDAAVAAAFPTDGRGGLQVSTPWTAYLANLRDHWHDLVARFYATSSSARYFRVQAAITASDSHAPPETVQFTVITAAAQGSTAPSGSIA